MKTDLAVVRFLDKALSYEGLRQTMKAKILVGIKGTAPIERLDKICLNFLRYSIILNTYKMSLKLGKVISSLKKPQFLMAITEDWCDDSGLTLPYLVKMVEVNSLL